MYCDLYSGGYIFETGTLACSHVISTWRCSCRLFSPCVFNFMTGVDAADLIAGTDEVPQSDIREILKQVNIEHACILFKSIMNSA